MPWDEKPEDCPKAFAIHNPVCENCAQRTECLQSSMGERLDAYIKLEEKALAKAEEWTEEQKKQKVQSTPYTTGPKYVKKDKKELLNEFLTDFCDFIGVLNSCLAAAGIVLDVPDQIALFMQWENYQFKNQYSPIIEEEKP